MPQETKSMPDPAATSPAGWAVDLRDPTLTTEALERAFDFRGDVTLTLADGRIVAGYLFDRIRGRSMSDSFVRVMGALSDEKVRVAYADIRHVAFSDRDPAAGKSFETWVKKYVEKKMAGEKAGIESEVLD